MNKKEIEEIGYRDGHLFCYLRPYATNYGTLESWIQLMARDSQIPRQGFTTYHAKFLEGYRASQKAKEAFIKEAFMPDEVKAHPYNEQECPEGYGWIVAPKLNPGCVVLFDGRDVAVMKVFITLEDVSKLHMHYVGFNAVEYGVFECSYDTQLAVKIGVVLEGYLVS